MKLKLLSSLCLVCIFLLLEVGISQTLIILLLGMLIVPPVFVLISTLKEGIPTILIELKSVFVSGKEILLISISQKNIILEAVFR